MLLEFYERVGQHLREWVAAPPKVSFSDPGKVIDGTTETVPSDEPMVSQGEELQIAGEIEPKTDEPLEAQVSDNEVEPLSITVNSSDRLVISDLPEDQEEPDRQTFNEAELN